MLFVSGGLKSG